MSTQRHRLLSFLPLVLLAAAVAGGCATSTPQPTSSPQGLVPPAESQAEYVIQRGDTLLIKFYYHPDNDQEVVVRPDGKIPLSLVGDVQAAGLTSVQLSEELVRRYSANLRDPKVAVGLKAQGARGIYVGGEVVRPSFVQYRQGVTAIQVILEAGGLKDTAKPSDVVVLQKGADDRYRVSKINIDEIISNGDMGSDITLGPSDVVFVPRSAVANANLFVEQYIIRMLPVRLNLPLLY